ncbi:MAG TPA: SDR family NAD(P)-dependent oxidoreductase [Geminicoccus sp.]|jgi:UDP-glucuronate 4-epimerase|uniref:SDR family NAD(P)-dependent oxidoreductase n=1 Tax=Geminicoccus sp. TaxID=2024832 RepID=UPI002E3281B6|nr:SDR family NAD(P)-dependent oxidoreductase [Geminicoccus sp.]HEX2529643.1 SDR family NAD(P)-dependent oxidoreductase [Geminicoccus sp.]
MAVLVTGVAGFIGFHVARALLERGEEVVGVDIVNAYYDPALKEARLQQLAGRDGYRFVKADIAELDQMRDLAEEHGDRITGVVHLAAQAGVRHSLTAPFDYVRSNLVGHMVMLEVARHHLPNLRSFVYASSSSVYGGNEKTPFSVDDPVERPVSLYAATKRADELMSYAYAHLYRIPQTGLRFFTVYGPWGRPDMAAYIFADAIAKGRPITLFNHGEMKRDFTYIDDIVAGTLAALDRPAQPNDQGVPARVYNLGNHRPNDLRTFVSIIEREMGREAVVQLAPMQPGDVPATYADIEASTRDLGFMPTTSLEEGLPKFIAWYKRYHGVN